MSNDGENAVAFNQDISGWDVRNVRSMQGVSGVADFSTINYSRLLVGWAALDPHVRSIHYC